jgi:hypothetical protein
MTDTDTDLIESLISRLDTEFASEDPATLRTAARHLRPTDPDLARIADELADLALDIDCRTGGSTLDPRPNQVSMMDQVTIVTDGGTSSGQIRQIWIGGVDITAIIRSISLTGTAPDSTLRMHAEVGSLGPILFAATEEVLA